MREVVIVENAKKNKSRERTTAKPLGLNAKRFPTLAELLKLAELCDVSYDELWELQANAKLCPDSAEYMDALQHGGVGDWKVEEARSMARKVGAKSIEDILVPFPLFHPQLDFVVWVSDAIKRLKKAAKVARKMASKMAEIAPNVGSKELAAAILEVLKKQNGTGIHGVDLLKLLPDEVAGDLKKLQKEGDDKWRASISKAIKDLRREHDIKSRPYRLVERKKK